MNAYIDYFEKAKKASLNLGMLDVEKVNAVLRDLAEAAVAETEYLLQENKKDLLRMDPKDPKYDRLELTAARIQGIASEIINVSKLSSPLGKVLLDRELPNGLKLSKVSVPMGVIGVIYEARPNVTFDVFSLCFKTGSASVLKGGSDAADSNRAIISVIHKVLEKHGLDPNIATLLPPERESTEALLNAVGYVDVLIPRGSQSLINFVRQKAKIPVIETGAGIVHTYFDETADIEKGKGIIANAKTRRVSVCNALDCLIVHSDRLNDLPDIAKALAEAKVEIFADPQSLKALEGKYPDELLLPANDEHFGTEFLSLKMAIKTVSSLDEALEHISKFSSKHSEAIISEDPANLEKFLNAVDAAAVYANASTAFTDGAQFGLGAEIGISTQKIHARGPMGLDEITSYKWIVKGTGQVRSA